MTQTSTTGRSAAKTADGEGESYWFYGDKAIVRSPEGALPIIIEHHVGAGAAAPLHVHHDVDDSFYLLSGQLALRCGDDTFVANAGDYVSVPKGVPHALSNVGDEDAVLLQTHDAELVPDVHPARGDSRRSAPSRRSDARLRNNESDCG